VEVRFASGGPATRHLESYGFAVENVVREPTPDVSSGEMKFASLWYLRYWVGYRGTKRRMRALIKQFAPDAIVGDEEFTSIVLAMERNVPHALITDELDLGFAKSPLARMIEGPISRWYHELQTRVQLLIIPETGNDSGNRRYVGPVVRDTTRSREEVRRELSLSKSETLVLVVVGGSGAGHYLIDKVADAVGRDSVGIVAAVAGEPNGARNPRVRYLGLFRDTQDLVAAADLVVSTAGKSTIDEAASSGTPIIAIPIGNHPEQERNAAQLGLNPRDVSKLDRLMSSKIGKREAPGNFQGAENASRLILSFLT